MQLRSKSRRDDCNGPYIHFESISLRIQYEGTSQSHSRNSPRSSLELHRWNCANKRPKKSEHRRNTQSRSHPPFDSGIDAFAKSDAIDQRWIVEMAQRTPSPGTIPVARRVWSLLYRNIAGGRDKNLYRAPSGASPQAEFLGGVRVLLKQARHRI